MQEQERKEVEQKIEALKKEQAECHGTKCEVYSRVCGYLRPVQGYNPGKKEEFSLRKTMKIECGCK